MRRPRKSPRKLPPKMVVTVRGKTLTVVRKPMTRFFGRTWERGPIEVDQALRPGGLPYLSTLVHEMAHHLNWSLTERRVQHLEYAIVNMVLSNPGLFRRIADQSPEA